MESEKITELIKSLAKENDIDIGQTREAIKSQFSFLARVISEYSDRSTYHFPSVRLPKFGLFHCPEGVIKKFKWYETFRSGKQKGGGIPGGTPDKGVQGDMGSGQGKG